MAILRIKALAAGKITQREKAIRDWVESYRQRVKKDYPNAVFETEFVLGCTVEEFVVYTETFMSPGMSWDTKTKHWQIKTIKQRDRLADPAAEFYRYNHYTNLRPVWVKHKGFMADPNGTSPLDRDGDQV